MFKYSKKTFLYLIHNYSLKLQKIQLYIKNCYYKNIYRQIIIDLLLLSNLLKQMDTYRKTIIRSC